MNTSKGVRFDPSAGNGGKGQTGANQRGSQLPSSLKKPSQAADEDYDDDFEDSGKKITQGQK